MEHSNEEHRTDSQLIDHFASIPSEAKRHAEVTIKSRTKEGQAEFGAAKRKEFDQRVSNSVFSICKRAEIP